MLRPFASLALCLALAPLALAQQFDLPASAISGRADLSTSMPALAKQVLAVYKDDDQLQSYLVRERPDGASFVEAMRAARPSHRW